MTGPAISDATGRDPVVLDPVVLPGLTALPRGLHLPCALGLDTGDTIVLVVAAVDAADVALVGADHTFKPLRVPAIPEYMVRQIGRKATQQSAEPA